jgi:small subunit ribosomal protein S4e
MHQTRQEVTRKIPITRKGTKYIARASTDLQNSIPVVVAVRDLLKIAKNAKEVKAMIHNKLLKLNGRHVRDSNESIRLFSILEADKKYVLTLLETGRFAFEETKSEERLCKVISRKLVSGKKIQLNLHDGSNIIGAKDVAVGDSLYLDFHGKVKSQVKFDKGKSCVVFRGKYIGAKGKIVSIEGDKCKVKFKDKEAELDTSSVMVE